MTWLLLLLAGPAFGQDSRSADIELLRPSFATGSMFGVDSPLHRGDGTLSVGLLTQYERDPLVLYVAGEEVGSVVANRQAFHLAAAWEVRDRLAVRAALPVAVQWGTEVPERSADGVGQGDASVGGRFTFGALGSPDRALTLGARADLLFPTGRKELWIGEPNVRLHASLLAAAELGAWEALGELGLMARQAVDTGADFTLGSELLLNVGLRYQVWEGRADLSTAIASRGGVADLFQGGAENASEWLFGLRLWTTEAVRLELGVGKGLADGYGTSEFRGLAAVVYERLKPPGPPPPPPIEPDVVDIVEDDPPPPPPPLPPAPAWEEGQLARVEEEQIVIRDPIQFELDTANILPESLPVLEAVASLVQSEVAIEHLVIEGHASQEGTFEYNWLLSNDRAQAVFQALIQVGVHPSRLSYRGMGEVMPKVLGEDEASLAVNRRVEFHIVARRQADDPWPAWPTTIPAPWDGLPLAILPPPPEPPPPPPQRGAAEPDPSTRVDPDEFRPADEVDDPTGAGDTDGGRPKEGP